MCKLVFVLFAVLFVSYVQSSAIDETSAQSLKHRALADKLEAAKTKIQEAKEKFDELAESLKTKGKKVALKVKETAIKLGNEVREAFKVILECSKQQLVPLSEKVKDEIKALMEGIKQIQQEASHKDKHGRNLGEQTKLHFANAKKHLEEAKNKLDEFIGRLVDAARNKIEEGAVAAQEFIDKVKESVSKFGQQFKESLKAILQYANQKLSEKDQ